MDSPNPEFPEITRLLALKRYELPPPGFPDRFRARVMARIAVERELAVRPWWRRAFEEFNWQRGMVVANGVALAGVAFLAVATFHVAHTVAIEDEEGQMYAALPLPATAGGKEPEIADASDSMMLASQESVPLAQPLPSNGLVVPVDVSFTMSAGNRSDSRDHTAPAWLFDPPSNRPQTRTPPQFIFSRGR